VVAAGVPARVIRDRHLVPVAPAQSAADGQSAT
jgi:hypothetical protein